MKILCIGEALIDMICTDKGTPLNHGVHFLKKAGGAPTNVAAAIAALGGDVDLVAKVGNDPFGQHLIDVMNGFGVNTQYLLQDEQAFTTLAFVSLMINGERDFVFSRGADGALTEDDLATINFSDYAIVHFGSATAFLPGYLQQTYIKALSKALAAGCFVSFDPNYRHLLYKNSIPSFIEQSWHYLQHAHFFKVSDEEAMLLTETNNLEAATNVFFAKTKAVFAITLGKEGTLLGINGQLELVPSIAVTPVDTTGAGDAFVGALLYQLKDRTATQIADLNKADWFNIVANANKAGARTCEYMGAMEAFKYLNSQIFN